ncbi:MAG: hypothetical protein HY370_09835 [Proteobacteria bacterium]|nr:hypothetical protein [Pseudomonadota bacterium]
MGLTGAFSLQNLKEVIYTRQNIWLYRQADSLSATFNGLSVSSKTSPENAGIVLPAISEILSDIANGKISGDVFKAAVERGKKFQADADLSKKYNPDKKTSAFDDFKAMLPQQPTQTRTIRTMAHANPAVS